MRSPLSKEADIHSNVDTYTTRRNTRRLFPTTTSPLPLTSPKQATLRGERLPEMSDQQFIKPEPGVSPSPMEEDDLYEDAGDLEFFDPSTAGNPFGSLYLARIPRGLWKAWSQLDDDAEIQIGTLRQWYDTAPDGSLKV